jgi:zinc-ribbon domain
MRFVARGGAGRRKAGIDHLVAATTPVVALPSSRDPRLVLVDGRIRAPAMLAVDLLTSALNAGRRRARSSRRRKRDDGTALGASAKRDRAARHTVANCGSRFQRFRATLGLAMTCPNCGKENPEGFVFCGYCSVPLAEQPPHRRSELLRDLELRQ